MNPLRITASGYGRFPSFDLEIPDGTVAVVGPNGAGKSTLLNAIELALFADGSRDLAPALGPFSDRLEIELVFEHAGQTYRVRRGYRVTAGGAGKATLDLERALGEAPSAGEPDAGAFWEPLTRESASATQALINATLGLTRATFNASSNMAQGNSGAFPEALPSVRKSMIGDILDPHGLWPKLAERAAGERKQAEQALAADQTRIGEREPVAAGLQELDLSLLAASTAVGVSQASLTDAEGTLEHAQAALAETSAAQERHKATVAAREAASSARETAREALSTATGFAGKLTPARRELADLEERAARIPELERAEQERRDAAAAAATTRAEKTRADADASQAAAAVDQIRRDGEKLAEQHETLAARLATLRQAPANTERCGECGRVHDRESSEQAITTLTGRLAEVAEQIEEKASVLRAAEHAHVEAVKAAAAIVVPDIYLPDRSGELAQARSAAEQRSAVTVLIQGYEDHAANVPALTDALREAAAALEQRESDVTVAAAQVGDQAALNQAVATARLSVTTRRNTLDEAKGTVTRLEAELDRARAATRDLEALRILIDQRQASLDTLRLAERAFGRDGIPTLIAENVIPTIEAEANRILEKLPTSNGTVFRVEMRTQREKRDGKGLIESLDILVSDRDTTREFLTYSGGERFRVSFALRWALAKLLAGRRGAESRLLVIDEPDGLDAGGMDALAQILRDEASTFSRVLIVSHNPLLASAFDQVIELASDGNVSRIVEATEAVAA